MNSNMPCVTGFPSPQRRLSQVVCVPAAPSTVSDLNFLLKPAPSARKYGTRRDPAPLPPSAPRRRTSNASRHPPRTPLSPPESSFLSLVDTPSTAYRHSPSSATSLSLPSPHINSKRNARAFDGFLSVTLAATPSSLKPHRISEDNYSDSSHRSKGSAVTLVDETHSPEVHKEKLAFLICDPYAASNPAINPPRSNPPIQNPSPLASLVSRFDHSPPSIPHLFSTSRHRSNSAAEKQASKGPTSIKKVISFSNLNATFRIPVSNKMSTIQHTSSTSSHSSGASASSTPRKQKKQDKVLPFTTSQIAEFDRMMGNTEAAKGRRPSTYVSHSRGEQEKVYVAPYVPLGGSAPSGTRSVGRDGVPHPTSSLGVHNLQERHVGTGGNSLPYFRDENGVLWNGQEEQEEYATLLERKKQESKKQKSRKSSVVAEPEDWRTFSATASSFDSHSPLSSMSRNSDTFSFGGQEDLGYDEAVMIPEGGARNGAGYMTVGGLVMKGSTGVAKSTRGGESFPVPLGGPSVAYPPAHPSSRPRGAERRRLPVPAYGQESTNSSSTSLGVASRQTPAAALDKEGKEEFFADAFKPSPQPSPTAASQLPVFPVAKPPTHRTAKRHSISSTFFSALGHQSSQQGSGGFGFLAPMGAPGAYNGIRQSSFSGPLSPTAPTPSFLAHVSSSKPSTTLAQREVKKKGSLLGVSNIFKKIGSK